MPSPRFLVLAAISALTLSRGPALRAQATAAPAADPATAPATPTTPTKEKPLQLDEVQVRAQSDEAGFDETGLGSYEHQLHDTPFSNDLVADGAFDDDPVQAQLSAELGQITSPSAVDLATGDTRLSLRGFPAPLLRDGFVQMGVPDILNTARTVVIQGPLVPVLGRAAPGGIQDFQTARPRAKTGRRFEYSLSSRQQQAAGFEWTGPAVPKRGWHRLAGNWSRRLGPEQFASSETRTVSAALAWKHTPAASTLFSLDYQQLAGTIGPGIPEYRRFTGDRIVGPYRPLARFNAFGPEAGIRRRSTTAGVIFDAQPHPKLALRAGVAGWWRQVDQDRFTTSLLNLATGLFEGTREPRHVEQPQHAVAANLELTGRFSTKRVEHKVLFALSQTWGTYLREERALSVADRNALPLSVRQFRLAAPNYYRPAFSRELYNRVLSDREEQVGYGSLELSERAAFAKGRFVVTGGVREDAVSLHVTDRRPGNTQPHVRDRVRQASYHCGLNYQVVPSRILLFTTTSTAFDPSTRVDVRTGRIQGNDTTRGYELGLKGRLAERALDWSASVFRLYNQDISRRNPLYDDPIFDANQTQPQLVAAGEERFSGVRTEGRWKPSVPWTFTARAAYVEAITTASPDLPQEVGRQLTRMPPFSAGASATYAFGKGRWAGVVLSLSYSYLGRYTANYEDKQRYRLDFPGYGQVALSASHSFVTRKKYTHQFALSIRNLLNLDLLASQARAAGDIEFTGTYRLLL